MQIIEKEKSTVDAIVLYRYQEWKHFEPIILAGGQVMKLYEFHSFFYDQS